MEPNHKKALCVSAALLSGGALIGAFLSMRFNERESPSHQEAVRIAVLDHPASDLDNMTLSAVESVEVSNRSSVTVTVDPKVWEDIQILFTSAHSAQGESWVEKQNRMYDIFKPEDVQTLLTKWTHSATFVEQRKELLGATPSPYLARILIALGAGVDSREAIDPLAEVKFKYPIDEAQSRLSSIRGELATFEDRYNAETSYGRDCGVKLPYQHYYALGTLHLALIEEQGANPALVDLYQSFLSGALERASRIDAGLTLDSSQEQIKQAVAIKKETPPEYWSTFWVGKLFGRSPEAGLQLTQVVLGASEIRSAQTLPEAVDLALDCLTNLNSWAKERCSKGESPYNMISSHLPHALFYGITDKQIREKFYEVAAQYGMQKDLELLLTPGSSATKEERLAALGALISSGNVTKETWNDVLFSAEREIGCIGASAELLLKSVNSPSNQLFGCGSAPSFTREQAVDLLKRAAKEAPHELVRALAVFSLLDLAKDDAELSDFLVETAKNGSTYPALAALTVLRANAVESVKFKEIFESATSQIEATVHGRNAALAVLALDTYFSRSLAQIGEELSNYRPPNDMPAADSDPEGARLYERYMQYREELNALLIRAEASGIPALAHQPARTEYIPKGCKIDKAELPQEIAAFSAELWQSRQYVADTLRPSLSNTKSGLMIKDPYLRLSSSK